MITGYVAIRNNSIVLNGKQVFSAPGTLDEFLVSACETFVADYPRFYKMDKLSKAGFIAAEILLREHPLSQYESDQIGLVLANKNASLDTDRRFIQSVGAVPSPALFVYTLPNIVAGEISIRHKIKGENAFFVADVFDPRLIAGYVSDLFVDACRVCMAGWVDVLDEQHDVFLYLTEKDQAGAAYEEAEHVSTLYRSTYGTIDSKSEETNY